VCVKHESRIVKKDWETGRDQLQCPGINGSIALTFIIQEQEILNFLMLRGLQAHIK
jgi:hypothetical protein